MERRAVDNGSYVIVVGIVVGIANLLIAVPGIEPLWRGTAIGLLAVIGIVHVMILSNAHLRLRGWSRESRQKRVLNGRSRLIPDLEQLTKATKELLYDNRVGALYALALAIEMRASKVGQLGPMVAESGQHYKVFMEMAEHQKGWEVSHFITIVRNANEHFRHLDPILEACYQMAQTAGMGGAMKPANTDPSIIKQWEDFKERFNLLRSQWQAYFDRIPAATGLHVALVGSAARSLPQAGRMS